jgi:hypothetical protein
VNQIVSAKFVKSTAQEAEMKTLGKLATLLGITAVLGATTFGVIQPADAHCHDHDHWRYNRCMEHRHWNQGYYNNNYNRYPAYGYGGGYPGYNAYGYGGGYGNNGYGGPGLMTRVFGRVF